MTATIYLPQQPPQSIPAMGLVLPHPTTGFVGVPDVVPGLLGCAPGLVDVLASGPGYVAYSVFDCEGEVNPAAMEAVAQLSGVSFDLEDDNATLCGPVILITAL